MWGLCGGGGGGFVRAWVSACVCVYMHACVRACACMRACVCVYVSTVWCGAVRAGVRVRVRACACACACVCVCVCVCVMGRLYLLDSVLLWRLRILFCS